MKMSRAIEIVNSEEEISVQYHGIPVWIEGVDELSNLATVHARGTHDVKRVVTVADLDEA
ncbi:H-type small acid-soluble spore protein [Peribacillus glennii]|uniref:Small, acid-soluble spore protein H n=1 Tax=Peribacillus glennii TaxID=2303991 RepID=A0A372LI42_9BACI|nr:H-type small acid-soluble spore protein [Peribacillus glennii]RFU65286.1 H-type small acid-soluble spore protein [Peribacillus glennii]